MKVHHYLDNHNGVSLIEELRYIKVEDRKEHILWSGGFQKGILSTTCRWALEMKSHFGFSAGCVVQAQAKEEIEHFLISEGFDEIIFKGDDLVSFETIKGIWNQHKILQFGEIKEEAAQQNKNNGEVYGLIFVRAGSSRLPNKCYEKVGEIETLRFLIQRLKKSTVWSKIIVCTTEDAQDDGIVKIAKEEGIDYYRGSENVVKRIEGLFGKFGRPPYFFRLTADNLFVDPEHVEQAFNLFTQGRFDYYRHAHVIDGCDFEILTEAAWNSLFWYYSNLLSEKESEYLTLFFKNRYFHTMDPLEYPLPVDWQAYRFTLDYQEDLDNIRRICGELGHIDFTYQELADALSTGNLYLPFIPENKALQISVTPRLGL